MNVHKLLAITLFTIAAQSANAGILFYDDAQIEEKKSDSYEIDQAAGTVTAEFKHDYNTRKGMLEIEEAAYYVPAIASLTAACCAPLFAACNYQILNDFLNSNSSWFIDATTGGLSKYCLNHCRETISNLNKSLIAIPVATLASCYFLYKLSKVEDKIKNLPKEERVTVAKMVQK